MSDTKNKILSIEKKVAAIDEKMKQLMLQKRELLTQKREIEEQEILDVVRSNGASVESLSGDLELVRLLKENNLTKEDIMELINPVQTVKSSNTTVPYSSSFTSIGGIKDESD